MQANSLKVKNRIDELYNNIMRHKNATRILIASCLDSEQHIILSKVLPNIEKFRYSVYIDELQKNLPYANHKNKMLSDIDDQNAYHFFKNNPDSQLIGYVRLHITPQCPTQIFVRLGLQSFINECTCPIGYVSKLMVGRGARQGYVALALMEAMIEFARAKHSNCEISFFHCTPMLVGLYQNYGFRKFGSPFEDPYVGIQIPMFFMPGDVRHFKAINSPFFAIAEKRPIAADLRDFLLSLIPV